MSSRHYHARNHSEKRFARMMKPFQMNHIVHDVGWILLCPRKMATQYGYREN